MITAARAGSPQPVYDAAVNVNVNVEDVDNTGNGADAPPGEEQPCAAAFGLWAPAVAAAALAAIAVSTAAIVSVAYAAARDIVAIQAWWG